tara:strand:+ start:882 stop:1529 length:648 start_codon:yes stop_codon:yes gene_type:complete
MAKARLSRIMEDAQRIASLALALLRARGRSVAGLWAFVANLPFVRRSSLRRQTHRLYRRFIWLTSDGYNFEVFYNTQLGAGHAAEQADERKIEQLPGEVLLAKARDLADHQQGGAAMRVLIGRAVRHAEARTPAAAPYRPTSHPQTLHAHWRDTIEAAFGSGSGPKAAKFQNTSKANGRRSGRALGHMASITVEDTATFDLSIPEAVAYRASTRH